MAYPLATVHAGDHQWSLYPDELSKVDYTLYMDSVHIASVDYISVRAAYVVYDINTCFYRLPIQYTLALNVRAHTHTYKQLLNVAVSAIRTAVPDYQLSYSILVWACDSMRPVTT